MSFQRLAAASLAVLLTGPAWAEIVVTDGYARAAMPGAPTGAAFMLLENTGPEDDRLIALRSDVAARAELHSHVAGADGVMQMRAIEGGIDLPAGSSHALERGGDHVMLLGLTRSLETGQSVHLTLVFEKAGEVDVEIPVDLERMPGEMNHGAMDHGTTGHGDGS